MRKTVVVFLALFLIAALAGCSQTTGGNAQPAAPGGDKPAAGGEKPGVQLTDPVTLRVASIDQGGNWYRYGATFADLWLKALPKGSRVDVLPYAGSLGNADILAKGESETGLLMNVVGRWAQDGTVAFADKDGDYQKLRTLVGGLDQFYFGAMVPKKLGIISLADIKQNQMSIRLYTQAKGTLGEFGARLVLEAYGITYDDIKAWGGSIQTTSLDVISDDFKDGRVDLWIQFMTAGHPAITDVSLNTEMQFLSFEDNIVKLLGDKYGLAPATLPAKTFNGQETATNMVGASTILATTADLPEAVAYNLTKALVENRDLLAQTYSGMSIFDPKTSWKPAQSGLPLHPGAERYFKEANLMP